MTDWLIVSTRLSKLFLILLFGFVLSCGFLMSCKRNSTSTRDEVPHPLPGDNISYRDSLQILYDVHVWMDSNFHTYRDYRKPFYQTNRDSVKLSVERIYYSPDKTKFIAWVLQRTPNNIEYNLPQGYYFDLSAVIGFRLDTNTIFTIYPFLERVSVGGSVTELLKDMESYYFRDMKYHVYYIIVNDPKFGGRVNPDHRYDDLAIFIAKEGGYNLNDSEFWTRSIVWQKGSNLPGLYPFQTNGNVYPGAKYAVMVLPDVAYPDSILKFFNK